MDSLTLQTLIIDAKHNGPPESGNGGWTSGIIAARLAASPGVPEVTLRRPAPLDTSLTVVHTDAGLRVVDPGDQVIATAARRDAEVTPVAPVTMDVALAAAKNYPGHGSHHFPTCFVCGPQRPDGLRIFPGRVAEGCTAAPFVMPAAPDQLTAAATVWAALDCPGGWTVIEAGQPWVLGRFAADVGRVPEPGTECVVVGEAVSRQGRKAVVRTSLYDAAAVLLARAEATWIKL